LQAASARQQELLQRLAASEQQVGKLEQRARAAEDALANSEASF